MRPATSPLLALAGFHLRPIEPADAPAWHAYLALPRVVEHTSWNVAGPHDLAPIIAWCNEANPASAIRFAVIDAVQDRLAGTIGFHTIVPAHGTAELAYDFHPDYWGRGLASDCCEAIVHWGVAQRGFVRVQATVLDTNARSIALLERRAFQREGLLRSYRRVRGQPRDFFMYSRLAGPGPA